MKKLIIRKPGKIGFEEHSLVHSDSKQLRLKTVMTGISHGTERVTFLGKSFFRMKNWMMIPAP